MTGTVEILPAIIPADAGALAEAAGKVGAFAPWVHLDVEDGVFTENFSWPYQTKGELVEAPLMLPHVAIEAHLMVHSPQDIGSALIAGGARRILAHIEAFKNPQDALVLVREWRSQGAQAGLAILIETPLEALEGAAEECDCIQIMSIAKIGAHGFPFDTRAIGRIGELHRKYPHVIISVDGGVALGNIADLARAGARRFAVGSGIFNQQNSTAAYENLSVAAARALS